MGYTEKQLKNMVKSPRYERRALAAAEGYGLDVLVNDENVFVRREVAKQGYGLEKLVNDPDWNARVWVAKHGYGLETLINDPRDDVRAAVAEQKFGLDVLVQDTSWVVRKKVAEQGYGLDILINDETVSVRREVAKQGYGLKILMNDVSDLVREEACKRILELVDSGDIKIAKDFAHGTFQQFGNDLDLTLELEKEMEDNPNEKFYRYAVGDFKLWFAQSMDNGNIFSVGLSTENDIFDKFNLYVYADEDALGGYYPNKFFLSSRWRDVTTEEAREFMLVMEQACDVLNKVEEFFKTSQHYELYSKFHSQEKSVEDFIKDASERSLETDTGAAGKDNIVKEF